MKFGEQLKTRMHPSWRFYYLDYDGLKYLLKERTGHPFTEVDEATFVEALEKEVEKVFDFRDVKGGELTRHVQHCENIVRTKSHTLLHVFLDANKEDPEALSSMEDEIGRITSELTQLANFTRLNYTGFVKLVKKHDKHTQFKLKAMFMLRLNARPLYLENVDNLIIRLSKLYNIIRNGGAHSATSMPESVSNTTFVRKTTKYWVHPDNVTELKCFVLKHLPVLVFDKSSGTSNNANNTTHDPAISSVYFDSDDFKLYMGRLEKTEGAEAIRIRWYGNIAPQPQQVFIERKTHREDWTGESSVKERFPLKFKHVDAYLSGDYTMTKHCEKLRAMPNAKETEINEMEQLALEIQDRVNELQLKPRLRTFYNRTAFQLPNDARVRISLDTELAMIREGDEFSSSWRRSDLEGIGYPFTSLKEGVDIVRFPFAILEVKLQTQLGQSPPSWVQTLVQSHLVEEVPKFSKFIHGCAVLYEKRVALFPFWLPQMDVDIRKMPVPLEGEDPEAAAHQRKLLRGHQTNQAEGSVEHLSESDDEHNELTSTRSPLQQDSVTIDLTPVEGSMGVNGDDERQPLLGHSSKRSLKSSFRPFSWFSHKKRPNASTPNPKKIAIPVRVEPKVYFANERTFLSWVHFSIYLGGIAAALVSLDQNESRLVGYIFTGVSVLFAIYALFLYQWRAKKIRERSPGPYDDRVGPVVLVLVFLGAMLTTVMLRISSPGK